MALPSDDLRRLIADLYSQPGVCGACLQLGSLIVAHDLPYSDDRIANLATQVNHLVTSYESVGRTVWQICAGYDNFWLLILCRNNTRLTLLLKPNTDPSLVASRAAHLLMEVDSPQSAITMPAHPASLATAPAVPQPAPVVPTPAPVNGNHPAMPKEDLERLLTGLLGRIIGSTQAARLVQREMEKSRVAATIPKEEARKIGLTILEYIPNRGKRSALTSELHSTLDS